MVRQAQIKDYNAIAYIKKTLALDLNKINNFAYRVEIQKSGFLMPLDFTMQGFKDDLRKLYLVSEHEDHVVGYLRFDEEQEMESGTKVFWFKPELKEAYFARPHADIGGICVLPGYKNHGFATEMLIAAEREIKAKGIFHIFSFVALSPITNFPSMMFHEKNGFERIAVSEPHTLFGMNNYQSFLYGKRLL